MFSATAFFASALLTGGAASADPAAAQTASTPTSGLEEVVVTAEKRSESLQDVPGSVAALTSEELDRRGITSVGSLMSGDVPSVRVVPFAGNPTILEVGMRGFLNPNGSDITNENPVPTYIDDVYYGRQNSLALELNDLERLEVLRGPQGTLFGKNAEGGALRMVSKDPSGDFDMNAKFEGGNFGYKKGTVHIDLPAVGILSTKIDLLGTDSNGWTTNPAPGQHNYGVLESGAGKLTLLLKPSDNLKFEYAGDYTSMKSTEDWNAQISYSPTGAPYNSVWGSQTSTPLSEPLATYRPLDTQVYWGNRFNAEWEINDNLTFKSISAQRVDKITEYNTAQIASVDPGPFFSPGYFTPGNANFFNCVLGPTFCNGVLTGVIPTYFIDHRQFSQEFQLIGKSDRWDWVAGLFYIKETGSQDETTNFGTVVPNVLATGYPFLPLAAPTSSAVIPGLFGPVSTAGADISESSKAVFGQATYRPPGFEDKLSFTAGLRVGKDDKSAVRPADGGDVWAAVTYPAIENAPIPGGLPCPQSPQCSPSVSHTQASPLAAIAYKITPDVSTYLRFSTGYQAPALSVGSQIFKYSEPSTVHAFELGIKSELAEHTVRLNLAAFYEEWKDAQENIQTVNSSTVEFFSGTPIYISGLEFDGAYQPVPGLTFEMAATYLHGTQSPMTNPFAPPPGFPTVSADFHLVALPTWSTSLGVTDEIAHTSYGVWRVNVQANGTASYYSVPNVDVPVSSYWLVNGKLVLGDIPMGSSGGRLEVGAFANNIFNKSYNTFVYEIPGPIVAGSYGPPRMYGASIAFKYK
ncbi:MAG: TonB-dependent receptor [Steroidobacteraceae bacterium]